MNVLVLCHRPVFPPDNGARLRIMHLTRQLARRHRVALLVPVSDDHQLEAMQHWLGAGVTVVPIVWPVAFGQRRSLGQLQPWPRDIYPAPPASAAVRTLADWYRRWQPQILLATDPAVGEYLRPYSECARVIDIAAENRHYIERVSRQAPAAQRPLWALRWLKWTLYTRRLGGIVDAWTVPAAGDRASLQRQIPADRPVMVIPNGVDTLANPFQPHPNPPPQLVHGGALSYEPNRDALLYFCTAIWPRIRQAAPATRLVITGDATGAPAPVANAPGVTLTGYLPEVQSVLTNCLAAVVPLRLGVGTRLKILEALALGLPVVSTSLGAEGLAVQSGQHLLLADEPATFADAVLSLMADPALRRHLAEAGRALVETTYAWTVIGAQLDAALLPLGRGGPMRHPLTAALAARRDDT